MLKVNFVFIFIKFINIFCMNYSFIKLYFITNFIWNQLIFPFSKLINFTEIVNSISYFYIEFLIQMNFCILCSQPFDSIKHLLYIGFWYHLVLYVEIVILNLIQYYMFRLFQFLNIEKLVEIKLCFKFMLCKFYRNFLIKSLR